MITAFIPALPVLTAFAYIPQEFKEFYLFTQENALLAPAGLSVFALPFKSLTTVFGVLCATSNTLSHSRMNSTEPAMPVFPSRTVILAVTPT